MKGMKKWALILVAALMGTTALAAEFITILTGGTSGVYYPLGVALSQIYGREMSEAKINVQATRASVENLNLLQAGRGEVAFTLGDSLSQAWKGVEEAGFKTPLHRLRAIAAIYPNYLQIVASAESGIRSLSDLKGKRVAVGAPRSGTELNARAIFQAAGMSYQDFSRVEYLPFGESVELLKNRQIDATLISAGLGAAAVRDLANAVAIVLVPIPAEVIAKIGDPAYQPGVIPAGTYTHQDRDVPTAMIRNFLVTHEGVKPDTVYRLTKAMFANLDHLAAAHAAARAIRLERATEGLPVPLHPGAERYYREVGVLR